MIKKNTKVVFVDGGDESSEELVGGIPLSVGEKIKVHRAEGTSEYEVVKKDVDCFLEGTDQTVDIVYAIKKIV